MNTNGARQCNSHHCKQVGSVYASGKHKGDHIGRNQKPQTQQYCFGSLTALARP